MLTITFKLHKLRQAIRQKCVGILARGVRLLRDNATPHTAGKTRETIEKMGWEILEHLPHSPDLAHSDFHLFGKSCQENVLPLIKKWKMKQETGLPTWTQIFMQKVF
jgi:hypothetical protein